MVLVGAPFIVGVGILLLAFLLSLFLFLPRSPLRRNSPFNLIIGILFFIGFLLILAQFFCGEASDISSFQSRSSAEIVARTTVKTGVTLYLIFAGGILYFSCLNMLFNKWKLVRHRKMYFFLIILVVAMAIFALFNPHFQMLWKYHYSKAQRQMPIDNGGEQTKIQIPANDHKEQADEIIVGPIERDTMGCGCHFLYDQKHDGVVFFSEGSFEGAVMNLNGKDMELIPVKQEFVTKPGPQVKKGDHESWYYRVGNTMIQLDNVVSRPCPSKDKTCEAIVYDVTIELKQGEKRQVIKTTGDCGC